MFFNRQVVDDHYGGMAFAAEGARCAAGLGDPKVKVMIMGTHGVLVIGAGVAETYVRALQTGRPLRILSDAIAERTAREWEDYPDSATAHLAELKAILDAEGADYAA